MLKKQEQSVSVRSAGFVTPTFVQAVKQAVNYWRKKKGTS